MFGGRDNGGNITGVVRAYPDNIPGLHNYYNYFVFVQTNGNNSGFERGLHTTGRSSNRKRTLLAAVTGVAVRGVADKILKTSVLGLPVILQPKAQKNIKKNPRAAQLTP